MSEEKIIISVETANSAKSVKELQQLLKAAKDEMLSAKDGSKQYQTALEVAAIATDKLALTNEKVKASLPTTSIRQLRGELLEAKNAMLQAEEGSAEYAAALKRAADASFQIREMNEQIKASAGDVGEALGNATKVMGGLLQGTAAVTAGMQLFGVENESVVEGIARLQQITAIAQGVQGMEGLGKSMKALALNIKGMTAGTKLAAIAQRAWNLVMAANPIMLMVAGIAALIGGLTLLFSWMSKNNAEQEKANKLAQQNLDLIDKQRSNTAWALEVAQAEGKTKKELIRLELEKRNEEAKSLIAEMKRLSEKDRLTKKEIEIGKELRKRSEENTLRIYRLQKDLTLLGIEEKRKAAELEAKNAEDAERKRLEAQRKAGEEAQKEREKQAELARQAKQKELENIDQINKQIYDSYLTDQQKLKEKHDAELALFEKHGKDTSLLISRQLQEIADLEKAEQDKKIAQMQEQAQREAEAMRMRNEMLLAEIDSYWTQVNNRNAGAYLNGEIGLNEFNSRQHASQIAYLESLLESESLSADQQLQVQAQLTAAKIQLMNTEVDHRRQTVSAIGTLLEVASDIAGKQTNSGKGLAIAAATIATWQSAQQGYLSAFLPVPTVASPFLAGLNVAAALATGFKNIREIVKVKVPGGGGGGTGGAGGGGGSPSIPSAPRVPQAPAIQRQITATRNQNTQTELDLARQPMRAYVVETELRSVQDRAQRNESEAQL